MSSGFRNINYAKQLYEALRNYFSINTAGNVSIMFKYCACFLQVLQAPFDAYDAARQINALVAQCGWLIGQATNLLNYLYDSELSRIYMTQSKTLNLSAPQFPYTTSVQVRGFAEAAKAQCRGFFDSISTSKVIINVPASVNLSALTATVEQIRLQGIPYSIQTF